jgi:hypothetical protein
MKQKAQSQIYKLKLPHIFINDIEKIEDILVDDLKETEITIGTDTTEYSSVSEIETSDQPINKLQIRTWSPAYIDIDLQPNDASIYIIDKNNPVLLGVAEKIKELLKHRERKTLWVINQLFYLSFIWGGPFGYIIGRSNLWILSIPLIITFIIVVYISFKKFSVIELTPYKYRKNFFIEHLSEIVILVIGAVITESIHVIINLFAK